MRKYLIAFSLLTFAVLDLAGCRSVSGIATATNADGVARARPLDNFGEILGPHKSAAPVRGATDR